MKQHRNLAAGKIGQENNSKGQYHKAETVNRVCKDDGALHSVSLLETAIPARREKAQEDIQQEKKNPGNTVMLLSETDIKEDEQDRDEQQLFGLGVHTKNYKVR